MEGEGKGQPVLVYKEYTGSAGVHFCTIDV